MSTSPTNIVQRYTFLAQSPGKQYRDRTADRHEHEMPVSVIAKTIAEAREKATVLNPNTPLALAYLATYRDETKKAVYYLAPKNADMFFDGWVYANSEDEMWSVFENITDFNRADFKITEIQSNTTVSANFNYTVLGYNLNNNNEEHEQVFIQIKNVHSEQEALDTAKTFIHRAHYVAFIVDQYS